MSLLPERRRELTDPTSLFVNLKLRNQSTEWTIVTSQIKQANVSHSVITAVSIKHSPPYVMK